MPFVKSKLMTEETTARVDCGEWRLGREIGRGAYGVVYVAANGMGERAAVKVCRRDDIGEERYERELRGAKLYRSIPPQEGLVRMWGLGEEDWGFYTVMDLADDEFGGAQESSAGYRPKTLASVIAGEKALPLKECVKLALSLANGLAALQRHHLLHRDIKPENVLYVGGRPVLSDPGLVVEESVAVSTVGTPVYLPPERKFTEPASDIYCLGLTLKAASFGRQVEDLDKGPAMEADTGAALFPAWWRILNKATDPTPSRRYQSAKALVKDLKVLRLKMALSSRRRSWVFKASIALTALGLVVIVASSLIGTSGMEGYDDVHLNDMPFTEEQSRYQKKLEKFIQDASAWLQEAVNTSMSAYTLCRRLSKELSRKIEETTDGSEAEKLSRIQVELLELEKKLRETSVKICMSHIKHEESLSLRGPTRGEVEERLQTVQKLLKEGDVFQRRTWEIGTVIHGKKWKPPSVRLPVTKDGSIDATSIQDEARKRIEES